jgi:hypothetical protein
MWWHPVYDHDPEHAYQRGVVERAAHELIDLPQAD